MRIHHKILVEAGDHTISEDCVRESYLEALDEAVRACMNLLNEK